MRAKQSEKPRKPLTPAEEAAGILDQIEDLGFDSKAIVTQVKPQVEYAVLRHLLIEAGICTEQQISQRFDVEFVETLRGVLQTAEEQRLTIEKAAARSRLFVPGRN